MTRRSFVLGKEIVTDFTMGWVFVIHFLTTLLCQGILIVSLKLICFKLLEG